MNTITTPINSDDFTLADFIDGDSPDLFAKTREFAPFFADWRGKGTYLYRRVVTSPCSDVVSVENIHDGTSREMVMLSSNNYLGLNTHPQVMEAARAAILKYGTSMCGAPHLNGTYDLVRTLEHKLAEFEGREDAMVFTTGYQANVGAISGLLRSKDVVIIDKLSHASIVDGCRLAHCDLRAFRHSDMADLERILKVCQTKYEGKLIVTDGVFSMDGDRAFLPDIVRLAKQYGARVMVDEAHGIGVLGATGRGTVEHFGLHDGVDLIMGTFSKTLSSTGGYIAGSTEVIDYIRHYARSYIFTASPTPPNAAAALAALEVMQREPQLRNRLWENIKHVHGALKERGFKVFPEQPESAIMVIVVGADIGLRRMSREVHEGGVFVSSVIYPAVAKNESRLRISLTAAHTRAELDKALDVLTSAGRRHGVLVQP